MDTAVVEQLLDEMLSSLEDLETKATATLQYLKDKEHATDKDLAPYLEQAASASNVRSRAARLRMMSLLSSALKNVQDSPEMPEEPKKKEGRTDAAARNATPATAAEPKPSAEAATPRQHAQTDRGEDATASEPKETQAPESKDQQRDNERNAPNAEIPGDAKGADETPQKDAA